VTGGECAGYRAGDERAGYRTGLLRTRWLYVWLLCILPALLSAQTFDFNATRSAEQLRGGVQSFHRGSYNEAALAFEKALSYQPSNILALTWLGRAQWKAGYEQEAARTWQQVVDSGAGSSLVRDWINVLAFRRGLGRELSGTVTWVVSSMLDAFQRDAYPFRRPTSVRPRPDGSFWVVAFGSNEIARFDANFVHLQSLKGGLQGFDRPYDVAEAPDGSLYVSEYGANRIAKVNARGDKVATFGATGRGNGALLGPQYLAFDSRGTLWVTDWGNNRVVRFSTDGAFMQAVADIDGPTGIATREDKLYVSERNGHRILVFDLSGNRLGSVGDGTLQDPEGLAFTADGSLLVADGNRILSGDLERETWTVLGDTSAWTKKLVQPAVTANGSLMGVDFDQSRVVLLTDTTSLYAGLVVRVDRVNALKFPEVYADVTIENRYGTPVVGLGRANFIVTESRFAVGAPSIALSNTAGRGTDVSLLIERSPDLDQMRGEVSDAVQQLYALATQGGRIKAVSAAERPVREADFGETRLRFLQQSLQAPPTKRWRFDLGARLAGDELVTVVSGAKRAIVFFTTGSLGPGPFQTYSLLEIAAYLRNNGIALYPVLFGDGAPDDDLSWLATSTGGKLYRSSAPGGMPEVMRDIRARVIPTYTLHYVSPSSPGFGEKYIPLEIEVTVQQVSGRDESGYYAPPSTGSGARQ
jgi:sugar lactone lactonase YvrE